MLLSRHRLLLIFPPGSIELSNITIQLFVQTSECHCQYEVFFSIPRGCPRGTYFSHL
jgi:hypothetical protein